MFRLVRCPPLLLEVQSGVFSVVKRDLSWDVENAFAGDWT